MLFGHKNIMSVICNSSILFYSAYYERNIENYLTVLKVNIQENINTTTITTAILIKLYKMPATVIIASCIFTNYLILTHHFADEAMETQRG